MSNERSEQQKQQENQVATWSELLMAVYAAQPQGNNWAQRSSPEHDRVCPHPCNRNTIQPNPVPQVLTNSLRRNNKTMNARRTTLTILSVLIVFTMIFGSAVAEDGQLFRRNISKTPDARDRPRPASIMMDFYVPAQASTGLVGPVDNYMLADDTDRWPMQTATTPSR